MAEKAIKPRCFNPRHDNAKVCTGLQGGVDCSIKARCVWVAEARVGPVHSDAPPGATMPAGRIQR